MLMRVKVYRNLNKPGVQYSIAHKGRVIDYRTHIVLRDCKFKHPNQKQLDEIRTGNRQVCAWINGDLLDEYPSDIVDARIVSCDPKKHDTFNIEGKTINEAEYVILTPDGRCKAQYKRSTEMRVLWH